MTGAVGGGGGPAQSPRVPQASVSTQPVAEQKVRSPTGGTAERRKVHTPPPEGGPQGDVRGQAGLPPLTPGGTPVPAARMLIWGQAGGDAGGFDGSSAGQHTPPPPQPVSPGGMHLSPASPSPPPGRPPAVQLGAGQGFDAAPAMAGGPGGALASPGPPSPGHGMYLGSCPSPQASPAARGGPGVGAAPGGSPGPPQAAPLVCPPRAGGGGGGGEPHHSGHVGGRTVLPPLSQTHSANMVPPQ